MKGPLLTKKDMMDVFFASDCSSDAYISSKGVHFSGTKVGLLIQFVVYMIIFDDLGCVFLLH